MQETVTAQEHVKRIQEEYLKSSPIALDSLTGAIDRLQKAFPRRGHFFMEFIQNADDAESEKLKITLKDGVVEIRNDGKPFKPKDVDSICRVGRSSKTPEEYIGYLGVGFKSVFLISAAPRIYSGEYRFKFDKNNWNKNSGAFPWQVVPIWLEDVGELGGNAWTTNFVVPVTGEIDAKLMAKIHDELKPDSLSNHTLLFLNHLREIEIEDQTTNTKRKIARTLENTKENYSVHRVDEADTSGNTQERWLVFRATREVPKDVKNDIITKDWERENVAKREILVAFKLSDSYELVEEKGTTHFGVFSYTPLKQVPSGLKFLVQADFLTGPSRQAMQEEALWNKWLAKELLDFIVSTCVPALLADEKWKYSFSSILQPGEWGHPIFDEYIKKPLTEYLRNNEVLIAEDSTPVKPTEAVSLDPEVRGILTTEALQIIYPGKKVLHPKCNTIDSSDITQGPSSVLDFAKSGEAVKLMPHMAAKGQFDWFKKIFKTLNMNDKSTLAGLRYYKCVPSSTGAMSEPPSLYMNIKKLNVPNEIAGNFTFVHPSLLDDLDVVQFLSKLDISELSEKDIENVLSQKALPGIGKNWANLTEQEKFQKLATFKNLWAQKKITAKDMSSVTLKTKSGKWIKPSEIAFSSEYNPPHRLEQLAQAGILDLPIEFLSADFAGKQDSPEWYKLSGELGVDSMVEDNAARSRMVQRIAVNVALQYEKSKGRSAIEFGESVKPGYDIESKGQSETRHIEVKGNRDPSPDFFVTTNEFVKLKADEKNYYLYFVTEALKNPTLHTIFGAKVTQSNFSVGLGSKLWKSLEDDEFHAQI